MYLTDTDTDTDQDWVDLGPSCFHPVETESLRVEEESIQSKQTPTTTIPYHTIPYQAVSSMKEENQGGKDMMRFKSLCCPSFSLSKTTKMLLLAYAVLLSAVRADLPPSNKVVFLLAGQSNMAGRGGVVGNHWDGIVPPDCAPSSAILRLTPDLRWEQAHEPLHAGIDAANHAVGVGPGMSFANALLRSGRAGAPVLGLVPCAVGGTRMAEWGKGTQLYADMLRRARVAVETGGRIEALLWFQGESDTVRWSDANSYGRRMAMLVRQLRADLGMPHLLVIQVGLASGLGQYTEVVREAQKGLKLRNVRFVDAKGLPLQDGHLHLSTQAQVQLGHMLAQSYLNYGTSQL